MQKQWQILNKVKSQKSKVKSEDLQEILLSNRGLKTKKEQEAFLHPDLSQVTVAAVGIDSKELTKTIKRIQKADKKHEQIVIYGDYDVDGITATAILWETLRELSIQAMPYIPHRVDEGYGLSIKGIDNLLQKYPECTLIITVDNGIVADKAVEYATTKGIQVIITDHHVPDTLEGSLPKSFTLVHTTKLCGAGIAYLVAQALKDAYGKKHSKEDDIHLELAALATVADLVPLQGANRAIVAFGAKMLCQTGRRGLVELYRQAGIDPKNIGVYEIGYQISPRLNAAGRIESAMDSLRLLCTNDPDKARLLAEQLQLTNSERQKITFDSARYAITKVKSQTSKIKTILVEADESYQEGVIGLIAGKLVEEFYRPSIVIAKGEKVSKGSVRSISGFNIIEFLRASSELFINVGGHPMAAGFTVETEKIEVLRKTLEERAAKLLDDGLLQRKLAIDCELSLDVLSQDLYKDLQQLSPFGMGNPQPVFASRNVYVRDIRVMGKENNHLRLILQQSDGGRVFEAVAFGMGSMAALIHQDDFIDIAYTLDENTWNGVTKLQLKIKDMKQQNGNSQS
jgi:single-stranded-DNA-specific exonuclease